MADAWQARSWPTKAAEMDYLTAALHSKSFRPPRAPLAYVSDIFDLEARKSSYLDSDAEAIALPDRACSNESFCTKLSTDRGMFYDVHGLIFDLVGPNMRLMIEAALGVAQAPSDGLSDVGELGTEKRQWLDILDLGCGRGRMGIELRSLANYITGVDLSKEALKHASRTKTYDSVKHGDAVAVTKVRFFVSFSMFIGSWISLFGSCRAAGIPLVMPSRERCPISPNRCLIGASLLRRMIFEGPCVIISTLLIRHFYDSLVALKGSGWPSSQVLVVDCVRCP